MIKIHVPADELELAMICGVLDSENIHFFVHNDYFGSMRIGPQIELLNKKAIMVAQEDAERAKNIILDFLDRERSDQAADETYSTSLKLRMIAKTVLFGWFIPGKKRRREPPGP